MTEAISVGLVLIAREVAADRYGLSRAHLQAAAGLSPDDLRDPDGLVPLAVFEDLLRFALARTGDPAFGLRCAEYVDLRSQGFWGYALMASRTLRERIGVHLRYQALRGPFDLTVREEGPAVTIEVRPRALSYELLPLVLDWGMAGSCLHLRRRAHPRVLPLEMWLSYGERPHHGLLREMVGGPVIFDAPCNRYQFPASELDRPLQGDPYLAQLATTQLDAKLARICESEHRIFVDDVRQRLASRLTSDASLARIARDLRVSARTLQRQLAALGVSFQELLEEVRLTRARQYLLESDDSIEQIASRLGYGDSSNFRRAFRRWTGSSPAAFRAAERMGAHRARAAG